MQLIATQQGPDQAAPNLQYVLATQRRGGPDISVPPRATARAEQHELRGHADAAASARAVCGDRSCQASGQQACRQLAHGGTDGVGIRPRASSMPAATPPHMGARGGLLSRAVAAEPPPSLAATTPSTVARTPTTGDAVALAGLLPCAGRHAAGSAAAETRQVPADGQRAKRRSSKAGAVGATPELGCGRADKAKRQLLEATPSTACHTGTPAQGQGVEQADRVDAGLDSQGGVVHEPLADMTAALAPASDHSCSPAIRPLLQGSAPMLPEGAPATSYQGAEQGGLPGQRHMCAGGPAAHRPVQLQGTRDRTQGAGQSAGDAHTQAQGPIVPQSTQHEQGHAHCDSNGSAGAGVIQAQAPSHQPPSTATAGAITAPSQHTRCVQARRALSCTPHHTAQPATPAQHSGMQARAMSAPAHARAPAQQSRAAQASQQSGPGNSAGVTSAATSQSAALPAERLLPGEQAQIQQLLRWGTGAQVPQLSQQREAVRHIVLEVCLRLDSWWLWLKGPLCRVLSRRRRNKACMFRAICAAALAVTWHLRCREQPPAPYTHAQSACAGHSTRCIRAARAGMP